VNDSDIPSLPPRPVKRTITVDPESEGQRVDVFLSDVLTSLSRSYIKKLIDEKHVLVDGRSVRAAHRVRAGERVDVREPPLADPQPRPEAFPLSVLHEDADLLVIDKPPGLVVHPAPGCPDGTLVNALLHHCRDLSGIGGVKRPGIVHRLDRDTSGVMVVTKNDFAHRDLARQFRGHQVRKVYIAFSGKRPDARELPAQGSFSTLFGRHPVHRKRFSSRVERGKEAESLYRILQRYQGEGWSALKVQMEPRTGRTHQIRVHLADAGHPILGDKLYGGRSARVFPGWILPGRQALHAHKLTFVHPASGECLSFTAPLPGDLMELERRLKEASDGP
jgi:23S rRNA pseudouridine1911/1915/1917 synthase